MREGKRGEKKNSDGGEMSCCITDKEKKIRTKKKRKEGVVAN